MDADRLRTRSLRDSRLTRILSAAIEAAEPGRLVERHLGEIALPKHSGLYLLGLGKAAEAMTFAAARSLGVVSGGLIVTKQSQGQATSDQQLGVGPLPPGRIRILEAGHPLPDDRSLRAGVAVAEFISSLRPSDLLICLLSGGASALVAAPAPGIGLDDLQALTSSLLASGADIEEINTVRRQVDLLKGGGLACSTRAAIVSLILSDVIGDRLEDIASGPTAPDPTTHARARSILRKYRIQAPEAINYALHLTELSRTTSRFDRVQNIIVGNNQMAVAAARSQAAAEGFAAETLAAALRGEAREVGQGLSNSLREALHTRPHPFCLIAGGETTVTLSGNGKGGRNQELALSAVDGLAGIANAVLVCCATDGNDGPTDAAGAVVTGETRQRGRQLGMQAADYLSRHDAYPFFDALGDLLRPGYTGTNVNDLLLCLGL